MHPNGTTLRLSPEDDHMHALEVARNFNESMYFNLFDHQQQIGGWFRIGNRPNEGHAEMSCCVYLPGSRVGFMYQRPALDHNERFDAGGMRFDVIEPMQTLRLRYQGSLCLLDDPQQMANPRQAFLSNPMVRCTIHLEFAALAAAFGGEPVDDTGAPIPQDPARSFARGHYEQHMRGHGTIELGGDLLTIRGYGLRDHSWGPRYWQSIQWYRWLPLVFGPDFAMVVSVIARAGDKPLHWGVVMDKGPQGTLVQRTVRHIVWHTQYDDQLQAIGQRVRVTTDCGAEYNLQGRAMAMIPLRNRRRSENGNVLHTRITEAMTRFECAGRTGYGMAEYLDQIIDGRPLGHPC